MACRLSPLAVCFLVIVLCPAAHVPESSTPKPLPHLRRQHHHHHHHHDEHQKPAATTDGDETEGDAAGRLAAAAADVAQVRKTKQQDGDDAGSDDVTSEELMTVAVLPEGWSTPAAFPLTAVPPLDGDPSTDLHPDPQQQDTERQRPHSGPTEHPQHEKTPTGQLNNPRIDPASHTHVKPGESLQSSQGVKGKHRSNHENEDVSSDQLPEDSGTYTEKLFAVFPVHAQEDDSDSFEREIRESAEKKSSHEKLVNRPRWQFRREHEENDSDGEEEAKQKSQQEKRSKVPFNKQRHFKGGKDNTGDSRPLKPHRPSWSHNRPRWDSPSEIPELKTHPNRTDDASKDADAIKVNSPDKDDKHKPADEAHGLKTEDETDGDTKNGDKRTVVYKKHGLQKIRLKNKTKGCPGCSKLEASITQARELHKQVLKAQLLDKLRLVPTFKQRPWPPKLPDQVFPDPPQRDHAGYDDQYYAKPTQLLVFGRDLGPRHRLRKARTGSYQFGVTGKVKGDVTSAALWVYKMKDAHDVHEQTLVLTELHFSKRQRLRERSLVARLDTQVQEGWVRFDITRLVQRWIKSKTPASLQMLAIRCKTCHRTNYRAIFGVKSNFRPVLVLQEQRREDSQRDRRSACDPNSRCCKFDLTVHFHDLGIHEIFHPRSIRAGYCYGTCERPDLFHYNHTLMMQRIRYGSYVPVNDTMRQRLQPCCVPVVLREASIMHYLNDGLDTQVSIVPNLLVEKCGCA